MDACLALLSGESDEQKLAGLLLVTRALDAEDKPKMKQVFDALGHKFVIRLLTTKRENSDNAPLFNSLAVNLLSSCASDPECLEATKLAYLALPIALTEETDTLLRKDAYDCLIRACDVSDEAALAVLRDASGFGVLLHRAELLASELDAGKREAADEAARKAREEKAAREAAEAAEADDGSGVGGSGESGVDQDGEEEEVIVIDDPYEAEAVKPPVTTAVVDVDATVADSGDDIGGEGVTVTTVESATTSTNNNSTADGNADNNANSAAREAEMSGEQNESEWTVADEYETVVGLLGTLTERLVAFVVAGEVSSTELTRELVSCVAVFANTDSRLKFDVLSLLGQLLMLLRSVERGSEADAATTTPAPRLWDKGAEWQCQLRASLFEVLSHKSLSPSQLAPLLVIVRVALDTFGPTWILASPSLPQSNNAAGADDDNGSSPYASNLEDFLRNPPVGHGKFLELVVQLARVEIRMLVEAESRTEVENQVVAACYNAATACVPVVASLLGESESLVEQLNAGLDTPFKPILAFDAIISITDTLRDCARVSMEHLIAIQAGETEECPLFSSSLLQFAAVWLAEDTDGFHSEVATVFPYLLKRLATASTETETGTPADSETRTHNYASNDPAASVGGSVSLVSFLPAFAHLLKSDDVAQQFLVSGGLATLLCVFGDLCNRLAEIAQAEFESGDEASDEDHVSGIYADTLQSVSYAATALFNLALVSDSGGSDYGNDNRSPGLGSAVAPTLIALTPLTRGLVEVGLVRGTALALCALLVRSLRTAGIDRVVRLINTTLSGNGSGSVIAGEGNVSTLLDEAQQHKLRAVLELNAPPDSGSGAGDGDGVTVAATITAVDAETLTNALLQPVFTWLRRELFDLVCDSTGLLEASSSCLVDLAVLVSASPLVAAAVDGVRSSLGRLLTSALNEGFTFAFETGDELEALTQATQEAARALAAKSVVV